MRRAHSIAVHLAVFLTGGTALVYEVIWQRYLSRITGNEVLATSLILGLFLAGLSAGYALSGSVSRRTAHPARWYGALEGVVGGWAVLFPHLFSIVERAARDWSFAPPGWMLLQGGLACLVLTAIPAVCMGGTVPLLTRAYSLSLSGATHTHARLYGTNTAGAFVGVLAAGYWLVPALGLPGSLRLAAVVNLTVALFFLVVPGRSPASSDDEGTPGERRPATDGPATGGWPVFPLYLIAFLNGAAVMGLENALIRISNITFGSSTYSFSLLVAVFVISLSMGSFWVGSRRTIRPSSLAVTQGMSLLLGWGLFITVDTWPYFGHLLRATFQSNAIGFWMFQAAILACLLLVLGIPVGCLGTTLPLVFHELKGELRLVGWQSGRIFSANAAGCVIGSLLGGWLLYYPMDLPGVLATLLCVVGVSMTLAAWRLGARLRWGALTLLSISLLLAAWRPCFDSTRFARGTFGLPRLAAFSLRGPAAFFREFHGPGVVRFYDDGPSGTVSVIEDGGASSPGGTPDPAPRAVVVNGKSDSHTLHDRQTLLLSAHLPALWSRARTNVLIIGLGTGVTAGEMSLYPDVARLQVAELSSSVVEALPLFGAFTHEVHRDPRLKIELGDAFRVLGRSRERWDIVISEPSNPWVTGVDLLFSAEFYRLVRDHLSDQGVLLQWVQKYAIDATTFMVMMNTVASAFEHVYVYEAEPGDLLLLATRWGLDVADEARAESTLRELPRVRRSLDLVGAKTFQDLRNRERMGLRALAGQVDGLGVESMDHPRVHYRAGFARFLGTGLGDAPADPSAEGTVFISDLLLTQPIRAHLQTNGIPRR